MAYVHFERGYVPCGFLIVRDGADPHDEANTVLIQTDWDFPGVASRMGWSIQNVQVQNRGYYGQVPCHHESSDGTVDCPECGLKPQTFINAAYDHIRDHAGKNFSELDDYFTN